MTSSEQPVHVTTTSSAGRLWLAAIALAIVAAAAWFAFLGWDHEYYEVDGVPQGPYRAWQVLACGASVVVASVIAYLLTRGTTAIFVLAASATVGFAVPWAMDAAAHDDSGLWVVGLLFLLVGAGAGLTVLLALCSLVPTRGGGTPTSSAQPPRAPKICS
ncbi:hypothetical protein [Nocardioides plantarum]|uniref:Uncharacterized protein n=1 Tax=Nocardioides plantarum TaxID=29299 RepID=A0ABV5K879_9ACTN|nr:hypothetical protein [Nocardioides plantarum]